MRAIRKILGVQNLGGTKLKGGIRCVDAVVLARAPKNTPDTSRTDPPEGFSIHATPAPGTLRRGRSSKPEDPLSRTLLQIWGPFVAGAPPGPKTPCYARPSGSDDPLLRKMIIGTKPLRRNKKIHPNSNFLWINC